MPPAMSGVHIRHVHLTVYVLRLTHRSSMLSDSRTPVPSTRTDLDGHHSQVMFAQYRPHRP